MPQFTLRWIFRIWMVRLTLRFFQADGGRCYPVPTACSLNFRTCCLSLRNTVRVFVAVIVVYDIIVLFLLWGSKMILFEFERRKKKDRAGKLETLAAERKAGRWGGESYTPEVSNWTLKSCTCWRLALLLECVSTEQEALGSILSTTWDSQRWRALCHPSYDHPPMHRTRGKSGFHRRGRRERGSGKKGRRGRKTSAPQECSDSQVRRAWYFGLYLENEKDTFSDSKVRRSTSEGL